MIENEGHDIDTDPPDPNGLCNHMALRTKASVRNSITVSGSNILGIRVNSISNGIAFSCDHEYLAGKSLLVDL